jgi:putative ABC transport system ATP-binding protein
MASANPIVVSGVNHFYGTGALRRQILFDINTEISAGEIVIMTGPSGSGKTTLLTLVAGLRSTQDGSLRVLGRELRGAGQRQMQRVRRDIGFIFQSHNLLRALSARENVLMSMRLHGDISGREAGRRADEILESVGLGERAHHFPDQLSGGQKQRVAIARALVTRPRIILADEPTASLDTKSGRDVVDLMHDLAKKQGCTVLLVTHDNRILDIADRILDLEDGHIASFTAAVTASAQNMMAALAQTVKRGELRRQVMEMPLSPFVSLLEQVTGEFERFVSVLDMSQSVAFESMLDEVLSAFTRKCGDLLQADRASLFVVDAKRGELWSKVADEAVEIRVPLSAGIAGHVARTGEALNIADAYAHPLFNREVDRQTGYRTRNILCLPIHDAQGRVFAVMQLLNKADNRAFDKKDEDLFRDFSSRIGVILAAWTSMKEAR